MLLLFFILITTTLCLPLESQSPCWNGWCMYHNPNGCQCMPDCKENCCLDYQQICGKKDMQQAPKFSNISPNSLDLHWDGRCEGKVELDMATEGHWILYEEFDCPDEKELIVEIQNLKAETRHHFRFRQGAHVLSKTGAVITTNSCAVLIQLNEEVTLPFLIESLKDHFDYLIVIDTGSDDNSLKMTRRLFPTLIESKQLEIIEMGDIRGQMYAARTKGIERAKELGCRYFVAAETDSVYYDKGARDMGRMAKDLPDGAKYFRYWWWEVAQVNWWHSKAWFYGMKNDIFLQKSSWDYYKHPIEKAFLCMTEGAEAGGNYVDESLNKKADNIYYGKDEDRGKFEYIPPVKEIFMIHLSQARAIDRKVLRLQSLNYDEKNAFDYSKHGEHFRTNLVPFKYEMIPESFARIIDNVIKVYEEFEENQ